MSINRNIEYYLSVNSDYAALDSIRQFIDHHAKAFGFKKNEASELALAADEACTNLIKHAYKFDKNKTIDISISSEQEQVFSIIIEDSAEPFDIADSPKVNINSYIKAMKPGGLGVHIIKAVIDVIHYKPASKKNGKNRLILKKYLSRK
ncbi:MAG: hypothetical protein B7C24_14375 [Bacteroidetes bacterium 4572_77]|nr:MAG: hypothetical protein B7C24_14375 [Bacteroidetes bacterium 4572_77]